MEGVGKKKIFKAQMHTNKISLAQVAVFVSSVLGATMTWNSKALWLLLSGVFDKAL